MQRNVLVGVSRSYKTISFDAVCVMMAATPVDLVLEERVARYKLRKGEEVVVNGIPIIVNGQDGIAVALKSVEKEVIRM